MSENNLNFDIEEPECEEQKKFLLSEANYVEDGNCSCGGSCWPACISFLVCVGIIIFVFWMFVLAPLNEIQSNNTTGPYDPANDPYYNPYYDDYNIPPPASVIPPPASGNSSNSNNSSNLTNLTVYNQTIDGNLTEYNQTIDGNLTEFD